MLAHATLADENGEPAWWSATHVVRLPSAITFLQALTTPGPVEATIVYDVDPVESGLDEFHGRYAAEWCPRKPESVLLQAEDLLRTVDDSLHPSFRLARDRHRIAHALPRHVVRSDTFDTTTQARRPLHALRHPWPAGTLTQGGRAHRSAVATPEQVADPDQHTTWWASDERHHILLDAGAFIETFPPSTDDNPSGGYLRGEGSTFADAEDAAWAKWTAKTTCPTLLAEGSHAWETRGYKNGAGFCATCGIFGSGVFDVAEVGDPCVVCGVRCWWSHVGTIGGETGTETGAEGGSSRHRQTRTVCRDHCPPHAWDVQDAIDERRSAVEAASATGRINLDWITRFLPAGCSPFDADPRTLGDAVYDGRAWLVDEMTAGRLAVAQRAGTGDAWRALAEA
ncbi:hypothetical protein ASF47_17920 [Nocardioides sp. Leaf285]|nr:hypothetical protein ASF47_17920 [Nocardioides sp. Leaf285]